MPEFLSRNSALNVQFYYYQPQGCLEGGEVTLSRTELLYLRSCHPKAQSQQEILCSLLFMLSSIPDVRDVNQLGGVTSVPMLATDIYKPSIEF